MSQGRSSSKDPAAPAGIALHLVVKRGHHGRYRFMMTGDGERIGGEVRIDGTDTSRSDSRARALAQIARLAEALLAGVTMRPDLDPDIRDPDIRAGSGAGPTGVDTSGPRLHTISGEGGHRGQI